MVLTELVIILLLSVINGLLSMSELAVVSARRSRLRRDAERGSDPARVALALAEDPGAFLATVQVGITLVGIIAGVYGGASLAERLDGLLSQVPALAGISATLSFVLVVAVITYLTLVIGELLPKRLALNNAEAIAKAVARPLAVLAAACRPLVWLLDRSTDLLAWLLRVRERTGPDVSEDDITSMVSEGTAAGAVDPREQEIIRRVFRIGDLAVSAIMTPRSEVVGLRRGMTLDEAWDLAVTRVHHHFPVFDEAQDHIVGVVAAKELAGLRLAGRKQPWEEITRPVLAIPESATVLRALELIREQGTTLAVVVDEFGGFIGIVTLHDVVEALVGGLGRVPGEAAEVTRRDDGSFLVDASLDVQDAFARMGIPYTLEDESGEYHTLGGFVLKRLGHIPRTGEHFDWDGWRFEVVDMDRHRVDKLLVSQRPDAQVAG
jgi:putative hemolysin